ncbi:MAG: lipase [Spirochaetia bacterium]|nr:lipase [Spirochaetia bacterium]
MILRLIDPSSLSYYRKIKLLHVYHPEYYVGLKPDTDMFIRHHSGLWEGRFTTNSMGFRASPEVNLERPHLACLGDSLVMGFGVSDHQTFCSLLNGIEINGESYQAFNLGVDAFGSLGYLNRLREVSEQMKLDTVLLFVSANDFNMVPELRAVGELSDDEKDEIRSKDPAYRTKFRLQFEATRLSYLLMALKLSYGHLQVKRIQFQNSIMEELKSSGLIKSDKKDAGLMHYLIHSFYRFPKENQCVINQTRPPALQCPWEIPSGEKCYDMSAPEMNLPELPEITANAYEEMIQLSRKKGFRLIPVMFPVHASAMYCLMNDRQSPEYRFAFQMRNFFEKRGIQVMDLSPYVKKICNVDFDFPHKGTRPPQMWDILIQGDGHLTRAGNEWAAKALIYELKRER